MAQVISGVTKRFRGHYERLPTDVKKQARAAYRLWREHPYHPSLQFKRVSPRQPIYSVRVGIGWRALGLYEGGTVSWFWIGSHEAYDALLKRL
jgi:hypothetical protein